MLAVRPVGHIAVSGEWREGARQQGPRGVAALAAVWGGRRGESCRPAELSPVGATMPDSSPWPCGRAVRSNLACGGYTGAPFCKVQARGTLAPELANITSLLELSLSGQQFTGAMAGGQKHSRGPTCLAALCMHSAGPPAGSSGPLTAGCVVGWHQHALSPTAAHAGTLPAAWGGNASFQSLQTLSLYSNQLRGTVPESWGGQGAWPELQKL